MLQTGNTGRTLRSAEAYDRPDRERRAERSRGPHNPGGAIAKKSASDGIYRVIDVIGTSTTSWEDAAKRAIATASKTVRDLRIAEVTKLDMKVEGGKVVAYRARVQLSFKYEG